ncbi:MAG: M23 family metallopeptidase [Treponema sp.]|nr:M23 family metallopeptidase [Treponema sp.]
MAKAAGKSFTKALPVILFFSLCVASPFFAIKYINYRENNFCNIKFKPASAKELDYLDLAMSSFALSNSTCFDSEGNVVFFGSGGEESLSQQQDLPEAVPFKQKVSFKSYTVQQGDTISSVCQKFGLKNISTLIAVNNISNVRSLRSGQKLTVPSLDGLNYTVASGDTIEGLSAKYNVSVEDLLDVNDLASSLLQKGQELFIPGAKMDSLSLRRAMGEIFVYPITAKWRLTSRFGYRPDPFTGVKQHHTGIDMACPTGTPVKAAKSGTVSFTGYSNVYGKYVIVTHADGYQTLYGHMSRITSKKGQIVDQGSQLGLVGSTGYSTGPHLHLSVYKNGKLIDPLSVLK